MSRELTPDDEVGGHREVEEKTCMSAGGRWTEHQRASQLLGSVIKTSVRQVIIKHSH